MPLIKQIHEATINGHLIQPFTTQDLKRWMDVNNITKDDGEMYADASIDAILSNSDRKNRPTSNKNIKILKSSLNSHGIKEYWFDE